MRVGEKNVVVVCSEYSFVSILNFDLETFPGHNNYLPLTSIIYKQHLDHVWTLN